MNNRSFNAFVALCGIVAVIAMMCNPLLTGWFLVKVIEFIIIITVVNFATRAVTGKGLIELIRSFEDKDK